MSVHEIIIKIRKGISVNGKNIDIGMDEDNLNIVMGKGEKIRNEYYYMDSNICVELENGKVRYIQINGYEEDDLHVMLDNMEIFVENKKDVIRYLEDLNGEPLVNDGIGDYIAEKIGLSVDVGISEEDIRDLIDSAMEDGTYEEMKEDIEEEINKMNHIQWIGIE